MTPRRKQQCNDDTQTMFFHKVRDNVLHETASRCLACDNVLHMQVEAHFLEREREKGASRTTIGMKTAMGNCRDLERPAGFVEAGIPKNVLLLMGMMTGLPALKWAPLMN